MELSLHQLVRTSGLASAWAAGPDAWLLIAARSGRMFAYGACALVLALFFAELGVSDERIGLFMTFTLAGDAGLSLLLTLIADHMGRRRTLLLGSVLMIASGAAFALCENYWVLLVAAVAGVISATGGDFGPLRAVEESMLSEVTDPDTRADVLAWYVTTSALGSSLGTEISGLVVQSLHGGGPDNGSENAGGWTLLQAYHVCFWVYAAMGIVNLVLCLLLSQRTELSRGEPTVESIRLVHNDGEEAVDGDDDDGLETAPANPPAAPASRFSQISRHTRSVMYGLWFLLMVDSLADGMASMALTSYYLDEKFHMGKDSLGSILSASFFLAACSSVLAGPLVRWMGLVRTMVFTHVPSSAAVLLFPLPNNVPATYALLLLRVGLNNLDQAPRSALIAAVVSPAERTAVMGITSTLRTLASMAGPAMTGLLAGHDQFWIAFVVAGALRLAYDAGLFAMFVNLRLVQHDGTDAEAYSVNDGQSRHSSDSNSSGSTVHERTPALVADGEVPLHLLRHSFEG